MSHRSTLSNLIRTAKPAANRVAVLRGLVRVLVLVLLITSGGAG